MSSTAIDEFIHTFYDCVCSACYNETFQNSAGYRAFNYFGEATDQVGRSLFKAALAGSLGNPSLLRDLLYKEYPMQTAFR